MTHATHILIALVLLGLLVALWELVARSCSFRQCHWVHVLDTLENSLERHWTGMSGYEIEKNRRVGLYQCARCRTLSVGSACSMTHQPPKAERAAP